MLFKNQFIVRVLFLMGLISGIFFARTIYAGTLSCAVRTSACNGGEVEIFEIQSTANSHAGLPAASYNNLVCCTGVTGLGNSCSGTYATALKLSGTSNAHVRQGTLANYPSATNACISVPSGGSVSVGYQATNCSGYDTTIGSMVGTTNSHVGDGNWAAGTTKICATAAMATATVACSTDISSISFGTLSENSISTASPNASTTMSCSNTASGCTLSIQDAGNGLSPGLATTSPAYLINSNSTTLSAGTEGYGIQATTTSSGNGGSLSLNMAYNKVGNDVGELSTTTVILASSTVDVSGREVVVTHKAAISSLTHAGSYTDTITYSCTAN